MTVRVVTVIAIIPLLLGAKAGEVASIDGANLQAPNWSPDGSQLSYEANFHDKKIVELYVGDGAKFEQVRTAARASTDLTSGFATKRSGGKVVHEIAWAPAAVGRYVYSASNESFDYDLYISGGGPVAKAPGADGGAAWSPDGKYIAFTSARTGEGDLYLIDVAAIEKPPKQLTKPRTASELYVSWSPNSDEMVFVGHSRTGDNIWLLPGLDSAAVQLTSWSGNQIHPRYSPTEPTIAFYANRENAQRFDLYVMPAKGSAEAKLLVKGVVSSASGPAWTPDGKHLVVVIDDDEAFDPIAAVNVETGATKRLPLGTVGHGDLDVTERNGAIWLAYVAQGKTYDAERDFKRLFTAELTDLL